MHSISFLRKGTWLTLAGVVAGNVSPVLVVLLARTFSPDIFGLYVSLQLLVLTVSKAATLGLDRGLAWYVAAQHEHPERGARALGAATRLAVLLSSVIVVGVAVAVALGWRGEGHGNGDGAFAVACFLALPCWCVLHLHAGALEGLLRPGYRILLNQGLVTALAPATALALVALGAGRWALPAGLVCANAVGAVLIIRAVRRELPGLAYWRKERLNRELFAYSWPIGLSDVIIGVRARADLWLVLLMAGPVAAGVYAVMSTLPSGVRVIRQNYDPVVISVVSSLPANRTRELPTVFSYAVHMVSSLQLLLAVVVLFFPAEILSLAGKEYVLEPSALSVLLVAHVIQGSLGMVGAVVLGLGESRALLFFNAGALLLSAALNVCWIPRLGLLGAALASAVTALVTSLATLALQLRLTRSWLFSRHLWSNLLLILLFSGAVFGLQAMLEQYSFLQRCALAASGCALILINLWHKRGHAALGAPAAYGASPSSTR